MMHACVEEKKFKDINYDAMQNIKKLMFIPIYWFIGPLMASGVTKAHADTARESSF